MKRPLFALLQACGSLPTVQVYLSVLGCFLLKIAVVILRAAGNLPPQPNDR